LCVNWASGAVVSAAKAAPVAASLVAHPQTSTQLSSVPAIFPISMLSTAERSGSQIIGQQAPFAQCLVDPAHCEWHHVDREGAFDRSEHEPVY